MKIKPLIDSSFYQVSSKTHFYRNIFLNSFPPTARHGQEDPGGRRRLRPGRSVLLLLHLGQVPVARHQQLRQWRGSLPRLEDAGLRGELWDFIFHQKIFYLENISGPPWKVWPRVGVRRHDLHRALGGHPGHTGLRPHLCLGLLHAGQHQRELSNNQTSPVGSQIIMFSHQNSQIFWFFYAIKIQRKAQNAPSRGHYLRCL